MELILWRHADAQMGVADMKRELTGKGRKQAARMAAWLRPRLEGNWLILVSPAVRATQTADALGLDYEVRSAIGTSANADALIREAGWPTRERNVILVGHQPTLGQAATRLLAGREGDMPFRKGAVWWFSGDRDGPMGFRETVLRAVISPDLVDA